MTSLFGSSPNSLYTQSPAPEPLQGATALTETWTRRAAGTLCLSTRGQPREAKQMARDLPFILIYLVPEADGIHDRQLQVHVALLQVIGAWPQADCALVVTGLLRLEGGVEEGVH